MHQLPRQAREHHQRRRILGSLRRSRRIRPRRTYARSNGYGRGTHEGSHGAGGRRSSGGGGAMFALEVAAMGMVLEFARGSARRGNCRTNRFRNRISSLVDESTDRQSLQQEQEADGQSSASTDNGCRACRNSTFRSYCGRIGRSENARLRRERKRRGHPRGIRWSLRWIYGGLIGASMQHRPSQVACDWAAAQ